jgi:hypothetical protein
MGVVEATETVPEKVMGGCGGRHRRGHLRDADAARRGRRSGVDLLVLPSREARARAVQGQRAQLARPRDPRGVPLGRNDERTGIFAEYEGWRRRIGHRRMGEARAATMEPSARPAREVRGWRHGSHRRSHRRKQRRAHRACASRDASAAARMEVSQSLARRLRALVEVSSRRPRSSGEVIDGTPTTPGTTGGERR